MNADEFACKGIVKRAVTHFPLIMTSDQQPKPGQEAAECEWLQDALHDWERAARFMQAPLEQKERYVADHAANTRFEGETMAHVLLRCQPQFLRCDERWVDGLLEAEGEIRGRNGQSCLSCLLGGCELKSFDFGCARFRQLYGRQRDWLDDGSATLLMCVCGGNPQLLGQDWARGLVEEQRGRRDRDGESALMRLFASPQAGEADLEGRWFAGLFGAEKGIRSASGETALMKLCSCNPQLLNADAWFVRRLLRQAGARARGGEVALVRALLSRRAEEIDLGSPAFRELLARERDAVAQCREAVQLRLCELNLRRLDGLLEALPALLECVMRAERWRRRLAGELVRYGARHVDLNDPALRGVWDGAQGKNGATLLAVLSRHSPGALNRNSRLLRALLDSTVRVDWYGYSAFHLAAQAGWRINLCSQQLSRLARAIQGSCALTLTLEQHLGRSRHSQLALQRGFEHSQQHFLVLLS